MSVNDRLCGGVNHRTTSRTRAYLLASVLSELAARDQCVTVLRLDAVGHPIEAFAVKRERTERSWREPTSKD